LTIVKKDHEEAGQRQKAEKGQKEITDKNGANTESARGKVRAIENIGEKSQIEKRKKEKKKKWIWEAEEKKAERKQEAQRTEVERKQEEQKKKTSMNENRASKESCAKKKTTREKDE